MDPPGGLNKAVDIHIAVPDMLYSLFLAKGSKQTDISYPCVKLDTIPCMVMSLTVTPYTSYIYLHYTTNQQIPDTHIRSEPAQTSSNIGKH